MWLFHSRNNPCGFFPFNAPPQLGMRGAVGHVRRRPLIKLWCSSNHGEIGENIASYPLGACSLVVAFTSVRIALNSHDEHSDAAAQFLNAATQFLPCSSAQTICLFS
jgi:hypothetical protein